MSSFLNQQDYKSLVQDHILAQVLANDFDILDEAEMMALSEMESYLSGRFDVQAIFAAQGNDRHKGVLMYAMDMTLYHLHSRVSPRNISQLRTDRYNRAIEWLEKVVSGELSPDLPKKVDEDDKPDNRLRWGSNEKPEFRF